MAAERGWSRERASAVNFPPQPTGVRAFGNVDATHEIGTVARHVQSTQDDDRLTARHAMRARPLVLPATETLFSACEAMRAMSAQEVLVQPGFWNPGTPPTLPIGLFTQSDAIFALTTRASGRGDDTSRLSGSGPLPSLSTPLRDLMSHPVRVIDADDDLDHALMLMRSLGIHRLPVMERGTLAGLLTRDSVMAAQHARVEALEVRAAHLEEQSLRDSLTGLANRRFFDAILERELSLCRRTGLPLGLLMIDADHFKAVNDAYGHPAGDDILRGLADRIQGSVRKADLVARIGGEEFAVLASVDSRDTLLTLAEKICSAVHSTKIRAECRGQLHHLRITISIGAAMFPDGARNGAELVTRADSALYRAKDEGRNRVVVAR